LIIEPRFVFKRKGFAVHRIFRLSVVCISLIIAGCSLDEKDQTAGWTPEKIYAEAREQMDNLKYDKAVGLYEKLEGRATGTVLGQQAQLEKAYAQYKNDEPILATATLDRFIKLNPASPALDYAYFLKGIVNFNDDSGFFSSIVSQDISERDQLAAKDAFAAFKELVARFPNSKYSEDAKMRMQFILNNLSRSEIKVADFYFKKGAYVAAINRAQSTIAEYPDVPSNEEALKILIKSYEALGLTQLKNDIQRVFDSTYGKDKKVPAPTLPKLGTDEIKKPWYRIW
jgi:outer membrane protein assembly factor BamD